MPSRMPFTPNQFRVLQAAFYGTAEAAGIASRRAKTRAVNEMVSAGLVYGGFEGGTLTVSGLRAYVDMCERRDAASGCIAYIQQAQRARERLAEVLQGCSL